ncbi:GTP-binding protein YPT7 [Tritrichomonas foetus]|uniref:Ras-related protein Rab-7b n=1 Tax=Tritrichomonas foetus TaxID=1144522 RepID=A0A1J4JG51_9EUKA|nr:GTP-binding protein YPT7 [Tritrichomonas foetus]|eukprot:OHS96180.1 GTP-binding protein YPT7 [Tritrichomonas foetus]
MATYRKSSLKVLVLGEMGVGKTCILNRFVSNEFSSQYKATIGSDCYSKIIDIDGKTISLQIWDTAGQERFLSLGSAFFRGSDCCIIVYDVTRPKSFEGVTKWKNHFMEQMGINQSNDFPFLLLGNKCDMSTKVIQPSAAREFAEMYGDMLFYEVSAKTAENVSTSFEAIIRKAIDYQKNNSEDIRLSPDIIKIESKETNKKTCC